MTSENHVCMGTDWDSHGCSMCGVAGGYPPPCPVLVLHRATQNQEQSPKTPEGGTPLKFDWGGHSGSYYLRSHAAVSPCTQKTVHHFYRGFFYQTNQNLECQIWNAPDLKTCNCMKNTSVDSKVHVLTSNN
jgi:hypothetical protein